jgi:hypothetical protein
LVSSEVFGFDERIEDEEEVTQKGSTESIPEGIVVPEFFLFEKSKLRSLQWERTTKYKQEREDVHHLGDN